MAPRQPVQRQPLELRGGGARAPRRVDLLLPSLNAGGAQQVYLTLARLLVAHHDVRLLVVNAEGPLRRALPAGVPVIELPGTRVIRAAPALVRYLRDRAPHALLPSIDHTNILAFAAAKVARRGTVVLPRIANTLSRSQARQDVSTMVIRRGSRAVYSRSPAVIVPSEGVGRDLTALGVPAGRVRVIPNPVVGPSLHASARQPAPHPWLETGVQRSVPVVVAVGRLVAQKDFGVLLEAVARARPGHRTRLIILGDGPLRDELSETARRLGVAEDVDMPGYIDDPFPYLSAADLFVLSSRWEGLPGALIQALACGTPVVATDCESGPREILADGRFGRLVPVGDAARLSDAVVASLTDPLRPRPEAWQPYTEDAALRAYLGVIDEFTREPLP